MSNEDVKSAYDKMKPEDQIRFIAGGPMPQAEKEAKYKEIEEKTGVKAADVLGSDGPPPGSGSR